MEINLVIDNICVIVWLCMSLWLVRSFVICTFTDPPGCKCAISIPCNDASSCHHSTNTYLHTLTL